MNDVGPLDPKPGPPIRFARSGNRWLLGNRPTRVPAEIIETTGVVVEKIELDVLR